MRPQNRGILIFLGKIWPHRIGWGLLALHLQEIICAYTPLIAIGDRGHDHDAGREGRIHGS